LPPLDYQLSDETVHYWTVNYDSDGRAIWIRAKGVRALIGEFGEYYVGKRIGSMGEDPFAVTHPETGFVVCQGTQESAMAALEEAAQLLASKGVDRTRRAIAQASRYRKPLLDPSQCDEIAIRAFLESPGRKGVGHAATAQA
jgi:hypothetical protein